MNDFYKNIVLDFDGTLIDTERVMLESVKEYAAMKGVRHDDAFTLQFVGASPDYIAEILVKEYGADFDAIGFLKGAVKYFNDNLVTKLTPLRAGARELLDYLYDNGWNITLATSTYKKIVDVELDGHSLRKYFKLVVTGDTV